MFDVNAISPGTDFMTELNKKLDYFIQHKINTDPVYSKVRIKIFAFLVQILDVKLTLF